MISATEMTPNHSDGGDHFGGGTGLRQSKPTTVSEHELNHHHISNDLTHFIRTLVATVYAKQEENISSLGATHFIL